MTQTFSASQLRAARALLNWSRADLAEQSGVSEPTIHRFENNAGAPELRTQNKIRIVLERAGVVFAERGVRWANEDYRLFEGSDCYLRLLDEVYYTLRDKPGSEVLSTCVDDTISPPEVVQSLQRIHDAGIKCRYLTYETATRFDLPLDKYRLIPSRFYTNSVMVIFDDKVATLRGVNDAVIIVRDQAQAKMLRGLFEMIWLQSPSPKKR